MAEISAAAATPASLFLKPQERLAWRVVQVAVWLVGIAIFAALLFVPDVGIHAFWNVLIPVAPALLAFAPGLWRNICPLASTALFPRHMGWSGRKRLSAEAQGRLLLAGVVLLLLIVPLRHVVLDLNGPATALTIAALAAVAVFMGFNYEWKSAWCSTLCPIHPVEKLYGQQALWTPPNAHCDMCHRCVAPCPDSTPAVHPLAGNRSAARRVAGVLLIGGFAGYIAAWFMVPDYAGTEGWSHLGEAYALPFLGMAISLAAYLLLRLILTRDSERWLILGFAAAAIASYYWFRLPALFGFGPFPGDGMLVDLRGVLPAWFPVASRVLTTALFFWWFLGRTATARAWGIRPHYAE